MEPPKVPRRRKPEGALYTSHTPEARHGQWNVPGTEPQGCGGVFFSGDDKMPGYGAAELSKAIRRLATVAVECEQPRPGERWSVFGEWGEWPEPPAEEEAQADARP